tara:strand:- start:3881 stop:4036 length:156 start_codon:yes stop_codon:yes gene_type:complete
MATKQEKREYRAHLASLVALYYGETNFSHNTQIAKNGSLSVKESEVSDKDK